MARDARRQLVVTRPTLWVIAIVAPIVLFIFTQLDPVQNAEGWFVRDLTGWDLGKKEVLADIFSPMWIVSILVAASLIRKLLNRYEGSAVRSQETGITQQLISAVRVRKLTWFASFGALAILMMSWTREWSRFGQQPEAFWYVLSILTVLLLLLIPVWWIRHELFDDIHRAASEWPFARRMDAYLFHPDDSGRSRWLLVLTFALITGMIAWTALGRFDALLQGMHPSGGSRIGMGGLASVFEFDLSQKPAEIVDRVGNWVSYSREIGAEFASGYEVSSLYLLVDSFVLVPAYTVGIGILLLHVRRTQPPNLGRSAAGSYQLLIGIGMAMLAILVSADLVENLMTWMVVRRAWFSPEMLSNWTVRIMWFAALFRTIALVALLAIGVLTLAFRSDRYRWLGDALVAVRGQILVILFVTVTLGMAQMEDVVRRWTVSVAFLTVAMATALAVLVHWTANRSLSLLRDEARTIEEGGEIDPATIRLPRFRSSVSLRAMVVYSIFGIAAVQVVLVGAFGVNIGLGFTIPTLMIALLWLFGVPLPGGAFRRGDRSIEKAVKRWFPRILGSALYVVLGLVVLRASITQLIYARHVDVWLIFCLLPVGIALYRIQTKSWATMGAIEFAVIGGVTVFGAVLWVVRGDPELSPVALTFLGIVITYGAMPFYYSHEPESLPSRLVDGRRSRLKTQPLLIVGATVAIVTGLSLVAFPLTVAGRIGTVAVVLLGAMLFAGFVAGAVGFAERTMPPKILVAFRLKRTPVFVLTFVWLSLAGLASTGASNDIPVIPRADSALDRPVTVEDVWNRWAQRNTPSASGNVAIPLVFIASSGGGIRAAAWTSYVMDCLFANTLDVDECVAAKNGASPVAVMSGVSGGSLGLATWTGSIFGGTDQVGTGDWVKSHLGDDHLASAMAWLLLVDTPRSFVGFGPAIRDRAEIMELSWEASWSDQDDPGHLSEGMFDQWHRYRQMPLMLFNGTSVNDPCRFNASVLTATAHPSGDTCTSLGTFEGQTEGVADSVVLAATQDLSDYLCPDQDIKVSTAAMLSARFPVITPSGRVGGSLSECGDRRREAFVVDGGYLDGSGAGTITELWHLFEYHVEAFNESHDACVVPFLVQIDNGYENPRAAAAGTSPIEVLVPIQTLIGSQFGRIANEREHAAIEFDRPLDLGGRPIGVYTIEGTEITSRYARITTRAHPGIQAPLGWTLSNASFDDLRAQLTIEENALELSEIQTWLTADLTCREGT